jgi:CO/xanthine dehydrogenase Mo-binding subunit
MGQGTLTALPQIVADRLNIPIESIKYHTPNTVKVANSGPTVASRTIMIVGELLIQTADKLKEAIGEYSDRSSYIVAVKKYLDLNQTDEFRARYKKPKEIIWDEDKFYGNGYDGYSLGCYVAEVEVDSIDYQVKVKEFYAFNNVGKVVNPLMAEGQVEGGVAQGVGYALYERVVHDEEGRVKNSRLSDYIVPLASDIPKLYVEFTKSDVKSKGLGELPMNGPAPAIANAVSHALSCAFDTIPIRAEDVEKLCR